MATEGQGGATAGRELSYEEKLFLRDVLHVRMTEIMLRQGRLHLLDDQEAMLQRAYLGKEYRALEVLRNKF